MPGLIGYRMGKLRIRGAGTHLGFGPAHANGKHDRNDHAKKYPAVDQVVDSHGQFVAGQVAEHHDEIGAEPVGNDRYDDRDGYEDQAALERMVGQVGVERPHGERGDEVADAAARFDDRPAAARDDEVLPFAIHRHTGGAQGDNREVGCPFHQARHQEIADRQGKEQEEQREGDDLAGHCRARRWRRRPQ